MDTKKIVALDFDGVVSDSVYECYVMAMKAFRDLGGKLTESSEIEKEFKKARSLVKVAEDYYVILKMIEENPKIDFDSITNEKFNAEKEKYKQKFEEFNKKFYQHRSEMQKKDEHGWYNLLREMPGVAKETKKIMKKKKVVIATTRDRDSTAKLLKNYGIEIAPEDIVSKEVFPDKRDQLRVISVKYNVPIKNIILVDDLLDQVKSVKGIGAKAAMADWGYSTPTQRKEAKKEGIPVIQKEDFSKQVMQILQNEYIKLLIYVLLAVLFLLILNKLNII